MLVGMMFRWHESTRGMHSCSLEYWIVCSARAKGHRRDNQLNINKRLNRVLLNTFQNPTCVTIVNRSCDHLKGKSTCYEIKGANASRGLTPFFSSKGAVAGVFWCTALFRPFIQKRESFQGSFYFYPRHKARCYTRFYLSYRV